jgi:predicted ribosomally synthesized peptide with SipW-like signal peptide
MKKKVLLTSMMSIAMLASIASGATYALFTAEDSTNIAVTAGKVAIDASVNADSMKTYSFDWTDETGQTFENGGTATYNSESGILVLDRLTPGDGINFDIEIKNNSNINIIYRIVCGAVLDKQDSEGSQKLVDALIANATVNGKVMNFSAGDATPWINLGPSNEKIIAKVNVELPSVAGDQNYLQGKSAGLFFNVEAIQGNGSYADAYVTNVEQLSAATKLGAKAVLLNDIVVEDASLFNGANINLNGYNLLSASNEVINEFNVNNSLRLEGITYPLTVKGSGEFTLANSNIVAEAEKVNALTLSNFTGKLIVDGNNLLKGAKNGNGLFVDENSTLDLSGKGNLTAIGNAGKEYHAKASYSTTEDTSFANAGGSGIVSTNDINIHDLNGLTAEGYGLYAFGIGGNVKNITIENTNIGMVRGGHANASKYANDYVDAKYNKSEPESGAAIGSSFFGSNITLKNVNIKEARGGSKAAGIGATYHNATTIVIEKSNIDAIYGGSSSAAIGGSRVSDNANSMDEDIYITIKDSKIKAYGGYFAAGIGSGYCTYCHNPEKFPLTTILIEGASVITAIGGKYGAGIGTGFHSGGLAGSIAATATINATSGEKVYKDAYTAAQNVGFGVIDPAREGLNNTCTFNNQGTIISFPPAAGN